MSTEAETDTCASCGIAAVDDVKLKDCSACKLVKYCGINCQREHRPKHKEACKIRAAELRDELLFKQPESTHLGDCPICCFPLSLDPLQKVYMECCSKSVCQGCFCTNAIREMKGSLEPKCSFCRSPLSKSEEESKTKHTKRNQANDPEAIYYEGHGLHNDGEYEAAFEYYKKAADLGHVIAHFGLSLMYLDGKGVAKDEKKGVYHLEQAAIGGHPAARYNLGCLDERDGQLDRAVKHWIIAANLGHDNSLKALKVSYREGLVSKEDFAAVLRAHQAAVDATKSPQREKGDAIQNQ